MPVSHKDMLTYKMDSLSKFHKVEVDNWMVSGQVNVSASQRFKSGRGLMVVSENTIEGCIQEAGGVYYQLVLVVGPSSSGKTERLMRLSERRQYPYLNVNLALSEKLIDIPRRQRSLEVRNIMQDLVGSQDCNVVMLDNIELLFDPSLQQDPLKCLQKLSRNKTVVTAWNGKLEDGQLTYAVPGHREYKEYDKPECLIVRMPKGKTGV